MPKNAQKKSGIVQSFNVSPKGHYEGLLLENKGELLQVNFPQEWSSTIADLAAPGKSIHIEVESHEKDGHGLHPVYRLLSLSNEKQGTFSLDESNGSGNGHFAGKVERLNYALNGEVNGAILDTGDFLHLKPHGAAALELALGMKVKGTGASRPMIGGHRVIEAAEVNGVALGQKPKPGKKAHH